MTSQLEQLLDKLKPDAAERIALTMLLLDGVQPKPIEMKIEPEKSGWTVPDVESYVIIMNDSSGHGIPIGKRVRCKMPAISYVPVNSSTDPITVGRNYVYAVQVWTNGGLTEEAAVRLTDCEPAP